MDHGLLPAHVHDHRGRGGIEIPDVVRYGLIIPLGLARRGVNSDDCVGIEVVARPYAAVEVW
jgi:hypothetical protein